MRPLAVLLVVGASGCLMAPAVPPTANPQRTRLWEDGTSLGVGMRTNFRARLTEGGETREVVYWPRQNVAAVQIPTFAARHAVLPRCDVGGQVGVGQVAADFRCGVGTQRGALSLAVGPRWLWWEGITGVAEVQAGVKSRSGFLLFGATGVTGGAYGHKVALDGLKLYEGSNLLLSPPDPAVVIWQRELAWTGAVVFGVPAGRGSDFPSVFMGVSVEVPVARSAPKFECSGCPEPRPFEAFDPGWRLGAIVGFAGRKR